MNTRSKPSKVMMRVIDWIAENDPNGTMTVREIAGLTGASIGTVQNARNAMKE